MTKANTYATISAIANHITDTFRILLIGIVSIQVFLFQQGLWIMRQELLIATEITLGVVTLSIVVDEIASNLYYDCMEEEMEKENLELENHLISS